MAGEYGELSRQTGEKRLTAEELRRAVTDYGRSLVAPPAGAWSPRSIVEIEKTQHEAWSVYIDLWTAEEGRSDLTLELTLRDSANDLYDVEIDNLHVL